MISLSLRYIGIMCLIVITTTAQAKDTMVWSVIHWPPLMILKGDDMGEGRYDVFLAYFQQEMPQYTHNTIEMSWNRIWRAIELGEKMCNILSLKTPDREQFALFSKPMGVTLPNRVIMRKATFEMLGRPKKLALTDLLSHPKLKGVIESQRSYTAELDAIIENRAQDSNLEKRTTDSVHLLKMLLHERFDYMIEYPYIAEYLYRAIPEAPVDIRSIEIEEIAPVSTAYMACPKTDWGTERIAAFNTAFDKIQNSEKYLDIMLMWYGHEQEKKTVLTSYKELIDSQ